MTTTQVLRSVDELQALEGDWHALAASARTPMLDHDWALSCAEAFHDDGTLRVATVRGRGGDLEGVAPLALESTPSGWRLRLIGSSRLHEPGGWLAASDEAISALSEPILRLGAPVLLQRVPEASALARALPDATRRRALVVARPTAPSLAVPTGDSWETYHGTLSSHITVNLPRLRRKAERVLGAMQITELYPTVGEVDALLETLVTIEGSGWKGRRGSALYCRADLRSFFRRYCRRAAARRQLRIATIAFAGEVGAMELSVNAYGRLWQLKIGYHERLGAYYPGLHLTEASIRSAFDQGLEAYEFLGSAAAWEERWRPMVRNYRLLMVYPFSAAGVIGACRDVTGVVWRRAQALAAARRAAL